MRIFTPRSELPFAGHPTLGSAHAAIETGRVSEGQTRIVQECGQGLVSISVHGDATARILTLGLPAGTVEPLGDDARLLSNALGGAPLVDVPPAIIDVGVVWIVAQVKSPQALMALTPDFNRLAALERRRGATGVSLFARYDDGAIETRSFAPSSGVDEDPVCGSGNGSIALFQTHYGILPAANYVARQGRCVGRDGEVLIGVDKNGSISVGGRAVTVARGQLEL